MVGPLFEGRMGRSAAYGAYLIKSEMEMPSLLTFNILLSMQPSWNTIASQPLVLQSSRTWS